MRFSVNSVEDIEKLHFSLQPDKLIGFDSVSPIGCLDLLHGLLLQASWLHFSIFQLPLDLFSKKGDKILYRLITGQFLFYLL